MVQTLQSQGCVQNWIETILISFLKPSFLPSVCFSESFLLLEDTEKTDIVIPAPTQIIWWWKSETKIFLMWKLLENSRKIE